jgi:type IV pilus assembly protein PilM
MVKGLPKIALPRITLPRIGFGSELLGVDIGTTSIKMCVLKKTKKGFSLGKMASRSYDEELLHDGNIIDRTFIAHELRDLIEKNSIKARLAASALSSYTVITKRISMPFLDSEALENSIKLEVENIIPFPLKDIYYNHYIMGIDEEKENMMNLLVVAAKREIVEGYMKTFELAKLNLSVLDVDVFALTNLIEQIYNPTDFSVLAVDIGAAITNIAILKGENIEFTREILMGGRHLTAEIEKFHRLGYKEAEEKKLRADADASDLIQDFVSNISSEMNKTINFYIATKPRETVGKIYLTGGSSLVPGMKERIQSDTGIDVEFLNPFLFLNQGQGGGQEGSEFFMTVALYLSSRIGENGL